MAYIKWSAFPSTAVAVDGDTLVGLHSDANYQFALSSTPAALAIGQWDDNINFSANNILGGYTTTATAAGTTALDVGSTYNQFFTGTTTQTVRMPVTATLALGQSYFIANNSTGIVTVTSSGGNSIIAIASNESVLITCIDLSLTTAAAWNYTYYNETVGVTSITGTADQIIADVPTGAVTLSLPQSINTTSSPTFASLTLSSPLTVANGGLGISSTPSNGQIPIGNGTNYTAATLTAGTGVSITNASGSVTINSSAGGVDWTTVAGTTQAADVDNGYICAAAGATTVTLPATAAIGSKVGVEALGAGGFILAANTGQTIQIGSSVTSSAGSLTSAAATDNVYVLCIVADTTWRVISTNSAGLTIA